MTQRKHPKRCLIVVLGMHRSGTSAITRALQTLGVELGDNLLAPMPNNNEKGFWEDLDILDLNTRMLAALGLDWDSLPVASQEQVESDALRSFREEATQTLQQKIKNSSHFGIKDPRICLLLPFWKPIFQQLNLNVFYVICVRHPLAVAQSLARRDQFSIEKGLQLWLGYSRTILAQTSNDPHVFLEYEFLLQAPEYSLKRIAKLVSLPVPKSSDLRLQDYKREFLSNDLNHFQTPTPQGLEIQAYAPAALLHIEMLESCYSDVSKALLPIRSQRFQKNLEAFFQQFIGENTHDRANIEELKSSLQALRDESAREQRTLESLRSRIASLEEHNREARAALAALFASTSWKITAPLRFTRYLMDRNSQEAAAMLFPRLRTITRTFLEKLPTPLRYRLQAFLRTLAHRLLPNAVQGRLAQTATNHPYPEQLKQLHELTLPKHTSNATIAIHIHLYYADLAPTFVQALSRMERPFDLYISIQVRANPVEIEAVVRKIPCLRGLDIRATPNLGRDLYPFVCIFGEALRKYDIIAHLHSKKSLYNQGATAGWLEYILDSLFRSPEDIARILERLSDASQTGIVYPQNFSGLPYMAYTWLANRSRAQQVQARFGLTSLPSGYFDYPAGSMFWARADAIAPFFEAQLNEDDFENESGQTDGTLAHTLERFLVLVPESLGFRHTILADQGSQDWSPWRFGQFFSRTQTVVTQQILANHAELILFDIFDTLLTRPLTDPDAIKQLVASQLAPKIAEAYSEYRQIAEQQARTSKGSDVGITEIFAAFEKLSRLNPAEVAQIKALEISTEIASVRPRHDAIQLLETAMRSGKRVALASDMFLPAETILEMLHRCGIHNPPKLYLSNAEGFRKDEGTLYSHILKQESVSADRTLMVGDNERSDFQIPCDMGMQFLHILRPTEIARASSRFAKLLAEHHASEFDPDREILLGMLVQRNFGRIFYSELPHGGFSPSDLFSPTAEDIGYSLLGPLAVGFAQWVAEIASQDAIDQLYFLAREGEFLKQVYDLWHEQTGLGPPASYLCVSRRAVTVPAIQTFEDIKAIAEPNYFRNSLRNFLLERFGVQLSDEESITLETNGLWKQNRALEINDQNPTHILPLLQHLTPRILQQAAEESEALRLYLSACGLYGARKPAVVDVGYAGSIQSALCRFTGRKIHGLYFATNTRAQQVADQNQVSIQACHANFVAEKSLEPALYSASFELEKLLSSNEAQVVRYYLDSEGKTIAEHRTLSHQETESENTRRQIRKGAIAFLQDHLEVRRTLFPHHRVPNPLARELYARFIHPLSDTERQIFKSLALDDFYCGRGVVS
ncbi:hypothetical protein HDN1F_01080 [gamma proteobacterium HdN1]|nr:hypothetical protein HDN1F_01080 [gamma proteobacterium HdN1]